MNSQHGARLPAGFECPSVTCPRRILRLADSPHWPPTYGTSSTAVAAAGASATGSAVAPQPAPALHIMLGCRRPAAGVSLKSSVYLCGTTGAVAGQCKAAGAAAGDHVSGAGLQDHTNAFTLAVATHRRWPPINTADFEAAGRHCIADGVLPWNRCLSQHREQTTALHAHKCRHTAHNALRMRMHRPTRPHSRS